MKTSHDLTPEEMAELKSIYFDQLSELAPDVLGDVTEPSGIDDAVIHMAYEGVMFVEEDFFCNIKE